MELQELLWTLRSAGGAVRIELLRKTWPRSPPEWLEEQEAQEMLRPHLETQHLPLVLEVLRTAPKAWRGHGACAGQLRTRTLLAMVEPCELHVLHVHLKALLGLEAGGLGRLRLRLAEAGSWMESPSFWLGPTTSPATAGSLLDHDFHFAIPVATGDCLANLFQQPTAGLEIQLEQNGVCLLQGELSALDFLAHLASAGDTSALSCIQLGPTRGSRGLLSCSVPGLVEGPRLFLDLRHSHTEAPLDALPYWMEAPRDAAAEGVAGEEVELHRLQLSLRSLTPMPGALETARARAEELKITGYSSLRVRAVEGNGSVLCGASWGEQMDEQMDEPTAHVSNLQLWLILELLLWSHEGALSSQLCLCHQPWDLTQLLDMATEPLLASVSLGPWAKLELELVVPQEIPADSQSFGEGDSVLADPTETADVTGADEAQVISEPAPEQSERQEVDDKSMVSPTPSSPSRSRPGSVSGSPQGGLAPLVPLAPSDDLEQWLEHQSPRALLSKVVEVAQLAAEMVSKPKAAVTETSCPSPSRSELAATSDVPPCGGMPLADASDLATFCAKEHRDETSTVCSMELRGPEPHAAPRRELPDEPEPAAECDAETPGPIAPSEAKHVALQGAAAMGSSFTCPGPKSSGAAPMPRRVAPTSAPLTSIGAGIPPPKVSEAAAPSSTSVCQLGGRGPLPPELIAAAVSVELPQDLAEAVTPGPPVKSPEPEELPMVSFTRPMQTTPPLSPASVMPALNETTLTSQRLDSWFPTPSPPSRPVAPAPPRWARTWASSSAPWPSPLALGSTRSTMTPRQRLAELAADVKATPSCVASPGALGKRTPGGGWSDRIDVNTKRLARIMRSMADESSDSS